MGRKKLSEVIGDYTMRGSRRNDAPGNIRSGMFVKDQRTNVLSDEESEAKKFRKTVRTIVVRSDGKILALTNPDDSFKNCLPGGGIDPGETDEDAARRELWEETGLIAGDLVKVRKEIVGNKVITLFRVIDYSGKLKSSPEGVPRWIEPGELRDTKHGDYHTKVLTQLGIL